jgi:hypothetical protein
MGHKKPLCEGVDSEFSRWAHETFGIPTTIQQITITPRVASGRAAVAIGGNDGAVVFMLISHHDRKQLEIRPHLMGLSTTTPPFSRTRRALRLTVRSRRQSRS